MATKGRKSAVPSGEKQPFVCGCMGTKHKAVNNCCSCGRIVCQHENRDACLACGEPLSPVLSADEMERTGADSSVVEAYRMKDKLLMFDREHAKRTQVHDAQADYYESSTWLSKDEKKRIDEREKARRKGLGRRPTSQVNITVSTGRKVAVTKAFDSTAPKLSAEPVTSAVPSEDIPDCMSEPNWDSDFAADERETEDDRTETSARSAGDTVNNSALLGSHTKAGYLYQLLKAGVDT